MREKIQIEFYETNNIEYELMVVINNGERELQARPYVKNDEGVIKKMGEDISAILESKGYVGKNLKIKINPLNLNGKIKLLNPFVPNLLKKSLEELNYFVSIN